MSKRQEAMAHEKQRLLDRSERSRLQLRHDLREVREALQWTRIATSAAPPIGRYAAGFALAIVAAGPMARFVALGTRTLLYAKLLGSVLSLIRAGIHRA